MVFAAANLVAMVVFASWETVPFHFIWVSLTLLYGFRVWPAKPTAITLACVIVGTGALILVDISHGSQPADELTEVPLMSAMFLAMVWHARRRLAVMEEIERVSHTNLQLLERERRFVQDASHELRTPITVALGHIELMARTAQDPELRGDAEVAADELLRLRALAERLLMLASLDAEPLRRAPVDVDGLVADALRRWAPAPRTWVRGDLSAGVAEVDRDRVALALDALVDNAVKHTNAGDRIELAASRRNGIVLLSVSDSGSGIPPQSAARIFDRFARADSSRTREAGGVGLGLAIVKAIAEAHGGAVRVRSAQGKGSIFQIVVPARPSDAHPLPPSGDASPPASIGQDPAADRPSTSPSTASS
jgi:signal transduction histidine kinase